MRKREYNYQLCSITKAILGEENIIGVPFLSRRLAGGRPDGDSDAKYARGSSLAKPLSSSSTSSADSYTLSSAFGPPRHFSIVLLISMAVSVSRG